MMTRETPKRPGRKQAALRVDGEKFPSLTKNPSLEFALRIRQALAAGKVRDEAVAMAREAMGQRAPGVTAVWTKPSDRPSKEPNATGRRATATRVRPKTSGKRSASADTAHPKR